jgi:hypothetical protein
LNTQVLFLRKETQAICKQFDDAEWTPFADVPGDPLADVPENVVTSDDVQMPAASDAPTQPSAKVRPIQMGELL